MKLTKKRTQLMQASVQVTLTLSNELKVGSLNIDTNTGGVSLDYVPLGTVTVKKGNGIPLPVVSEMELLSLMRKEYQSSEPSIITVTATNLHIASKGGRVLVMDDGFTDDI